MFLRSFFSVLLCFWMIAVSSQSIIPRFETIGVNEGLSQSSVYSIYQDSRGFMWFGTADGLNRFDGSEIKIYKNKEKIENPGNSNLVRGKLCEDENNNIWFTTETGLYYFDRRQELVKAFRKFPKQASGIIYYELLYLDKHQNLWLFNKGFGFLKINSRTGLASHYPYPFKLHDLNTTLSDAVADKDGNIWFNLYRGGGFYRFNTITTQFELFFKGENYLNIFFGKNKTYLISENKICRLDAGFVKKDSMDLGFSQKPTTNIHNVYEDKYERLWLPSLVYGLFCYDFYQKKVHRYYHDNSKLKSISTDYVTVLACDRSQNLWIGTDGGGVCKLDLKPSRFNLFPLNESDYSLKDYFVKCLYEDDQKRIWFGTNSNGLSIYDPRDGAMKLFLHQENNPLSLPGNNVSAIFKDRQNNMWIGCDMGIALFNERKKNFETVRLETPMRRAPGKSFVFRIIQLKNDDLIAVTACGQVRIKKDNKGNFFGTLEFNSSGGNFWATDMVEMSGNDVWVAAPLNGLFHSSFVYGRDSFFVEEKFFSGIDLRSLHQDEQNPLVIWIASGKGLIRFDTRTKQFDLYNEDDGMVNSYVYGILEDDKHNLWLSTNGGLIYFDRKKNSFQNFTAKDGLQSNEFNTGAFYKGASGNFYFGGIKGFNWFKNIYPDLTDYAYKPLVAITDIFLNEQRLKEDSVFLKKKTINLSYYRNNIVFNFAALDFTRPEANKIQYRLEGWDPHWVTTQAKTVRYSNLSPGNYIFKIKACNADGVWSDEQSIIVFIQAPFWKRWWFYSLIGMASLITAIFITRVIAQKKFRQQLHELEKQKAVEQERNRISRDMHDEIGSGLTHIALMSELMQTQKKAHEELKKDVGMISSSARKLVESMSEIVWALNPQNDSLENLLAYLREQTLAYFEPFDIQYSIQFPDKIPFIKLSNEQRRNLFLVVKEALNNALKHSGANAVNLSMEYVSNTIHFYVSDNGKGIDRNKIRTASNGLKNMQKRMSDIGGAFDLNSGETGCFIHLSMQVTHERREGATTFFTSSKKQP